MTMVTIAHDSCERLIHLVNDILDVQKIEAGKMSINLRPLVVETLIEKGIEANRAYAHSFGVTIRFENRAAGVSVLADSDRLIQVLTNLLSNGVKFSPRNATVTLSLDRHDRKVRIAVRDQGTGIPEEFRSRIFQKFSQADSSDARSKQGTGLGLSICKAIMDRIGGSIGFESTLETGTTFYVDLAEHTELEPKSAVGFTDLLRIFICEDDHNFSTILKLSLESAGFSVDVADSAAEAKALLLRNRYVAMTLDLVLPDQDGDVLLQELRRLPATRDLPVVVVSAYLDEARRKMGGEGDGIFDWLEKPIDPERLKTTLQRAVRAGKTPVLGIAP
jgi:CheY-like chemotaxis protein